MPQLDLNSPHGLQVFRATRYKTKKESRQQEECLTVEVNRLSLAFPVLKCGTLLADARLPEPENRHRDPRWQGM